MQHQPGEQSDQCCVLVHVRVLHSLPSKPCTALFLSLVSDPNTANTTPTSCLRTAGLVCLFFKQSPCGKHLHLSHLTAYVQHLLRGWAVFQPSAEEGQGSLSRSGSVQPGRCCSRLDKTAFMKTLTEVPWLTQVMLPEFTEMGRRQSSQE